MVAEKTRFHHGTLRAISAVKVEQRGALQDILKCKLHSFYYSIMLGQYRLFGSMSNYRLFYLWKVGFISGWFVKESKQDLKDQTEKCPVPPLWCLRLPFTVSPQLTIVVPLPSKWLLV